MSERPENLPEDGQIIFAEEAPGFFYDLTVVLNHSEYDGRYIDVAGESACSHNTFAAQDLPTLRAFASAVQKAIQYLEAENV